MLLGQWAVKLPATERPAAYRSLITLMYEEDAAVQLAAVSLPLLCIRSTQIWPASHLYTHMQPCAGVEHCLSPGAIGAFMARTVKFAWVFLIRMQAHQ
jgi:hypothetical protein